MSKREIFFKIILKQAIKRIVPPMGNEIITLVKDTSLANVIGVYELIFKAQTQLSHGLIWPIFYAGLFYLAFNAIVTFVMQRIEKKLEYIKV
jgi:polar amino acid transport system permease protein